MDQFPATIRQEMRCGYEPALAGALSVFRPPGYECGEDGPSVCPGYSTKLPEVREASWARLHWERGSLREWARGEPTDQLIEAIEVLEVQTSKVERYCFDNPRKK